MNHSQTEDGQFRRRSAVAGILAASGLLLVVLSAQAQQARSFAAADLTRAKSPASAQLSNAEVEKRVNALLEKMTLEEKLGQLVQYNDQGINGEAASADEDVNAPGKNPIAKIRVNALQLAGEGRMGSMLNVVGAARTHEFQQAAVEKSRLHIPLLFGADIIHGYRTIYPVPLGLAASFDPALVEQLSHISAVESRTVGVNWFYSPMVDISRDPRWGRTVEGAGEDPYLGAAIARAYIHGYQGKSLSDPGSVAACVKHFAAYGAAEAGREYNTTDMSLSRLQQFYLPPYKAAAEAGAASYMSAFNALNGVPASANSFMLQDLLRDSWGFTGPVVSDYTAVMELRNHGIAKDPAQAAAKAIVAGVDIDMMSHYYDLELPEMIRQGKVSMAVVDEAVRRVLRLKFALGLFENPWAVGTEVTAPVAEHRALVRRAAEESFVLLRNEADTQGVALLPLQKDAKRIALIGPLADNGAEMINVWGNPGLKPDAVTLKDALSARLKQSGGTLLYVPGTEIDSQDESGFASALQAARDADVVVMALGESGEMSGEAGSRASLDLPGNQQKLLQQVVATGKPVVLVLFSGRPLVLTWAAQHVTSILEAWFPGTEAGNALANVLYGDVVPSGKLPMSFPWSVGQEPIYYNQFPTGRPASQADLMRRPEGDARFISRYVDAPNSPLYPFGFGLSYTQFAYSNVQVSRKNIPVSEAAPGKSALIQVSATLKNVGNRTADEVVQCYLRIQGASLEQPVRNLKGFRRVALKAGESVQVQFDLSYDDLAFYDNAGRQTVEPAQYTVWVGGSSLAADSASFETTAE